jgi:hypothetical protein
MSAVTPVPGTTRYLCPLECGWHHDRPPLPMPTDATVPIAPEAIQHMASVVLRQDVERVEEALREHLATHTTVEFVRVIHDLRVEVARLRDAGSVGSGEETT